MRFPAIAYALAAVVIAVASSAMAEDAPRRVKVAVALAHVSTSPSEEKLTPSSRRSVILVDLGDGRFAIEEAGPAGVSKAAERAIQSTPKKVEKPEPTPKPEIKSLAPTYQEAYRRVSMGETLVYHSAPGDPVEPGTYECFPGASGPVLRVIPTFVESLPSGCSTGNCKAKIR